MLESSEDLTKLLQDIIRLCDREVAKIGLDLENRGTHGHIRFDVLVAVENLVLEIEEIQVMKRKVPHTSPEFSMNIIVLAENARERLLDRVNSAA